ncbi:uncharacterized protein DUF2474 [Jezberella montanilacus]|jgi:hypothetical protein|uniref:Uncharacterized protein DUF2474 n=1 Tax=Jezberella montanilacus TaxID=323426 RepID=A0A2T0XB00_9BURK|nr:DUF2474 domain-containing protein [Jezberella montanilacus]PRY96105.1 uncharacterized protein DUF2474 [Jezberella montanilacus]
MKSTATKRFGWFVLIWAASVLALGIVAYGIRWMIRH